MKTIALFLEPLDPLFFRDGRPFGAATRLKSTLPTPQTLSGALRSYLLRAQGCDLASAASLETLAEVSCRGPWLSRSNAAVTAVDQVYVEVPAALKQHKGEAGTYAVLRPLAPEKLPGWQGQGWPLWHRGRVHLERVPGLLSLQGLKQFLQGHVPDAHTLVSRHELYRYEERTGIGMSKQGQSAEEGLIYSIEALRLLEGVGFYCEVELPETLAAYYAQPVVLRLGGESRRVLAHPVRPVAWPTPVTQALDFQVLYTLSDSPLRPDWARDLSVLSVAQEAYRAISGWDMAKAGPKPTRYVLPAGSVLYFKSGATLPSRLVSQEDAQLGWGHYLQGVQ